MSQSMLDAARLSLKEAERLDGLSDSVANRAEVRDELRLAQTQALIAIAEALTECDDPCECFDEPDCECADPDCECHADAPEPCPVPDCESDLDSVEGPMSLIRVIVTPEWIRLTSPYCVVAQ